MLRQPVIATLLGAVLALGLALRPSHSGEPVPAGPAFVVHADSAGPQAFPAVALRDSGRFMVVWNRLEPLGPVFGRLFDATDQPVAKEFLLDAGDNVRQLSPAIALGAEGGFVATWSNYEATASGGEFRVWARRFDAGAAPLAPGFEVSQGTFNQLPSIASDGQGNFVIAWAGVDGHYSGIRARRYDAGGNALGDDFLVNAMTTGQQDWPEVAANAAGQFVVIWHDDYAAYPSPSVQARRYDADGEPLGAEIEVGTPAVGGQSKPAVAMDAAGGFVVVWSSLRSAYDHDVLARRFDGDGQPVGPEFEVSTNLRASQVGPRIRMDGSGEFVVVWTRQGPGYLPSAVMVQRFDAGANRLGGELEVQAPATVAQFLPELGVDTEGGFVVAWMNDPGSWEFDVLARRFKVPFFSDGFETGDTSAWAVAVP